MKNKLLVIGITILLIISSAIVSYANTETTVTLHVNKTQVKVNETFTVTLKATCPDGINGIDTTYSYDKEKLELVSANVASSNFASLGVDNQITVIASSTEKIQSADVYILTFKVKDGVEVGSIAKVSIAETLLDSDAQTNSEHIIPAQEVTVTVIEQQDSSGDENPGDEEPEGEEPEGGQPEGGQPEGEQPEGGQPEGEQPEGGQPEGEQPEDEEPEGEEPKGEQPKNEVTDKKDETAANKEIPKAGLSTILVTGIVAVIIVTAILYKKNKKYEGIK